MVHGARLVVDSRAKPRVTLDELLAASDYSQFLKLPRNGDGSSAPVAGSELL